MEPCVFGDLKDVAEGANFVVDTGDGDVANFDYKQASKHLSARG